MRRLLGLLLFLPLAFAHAEATYELSKPEASANGIPNLAIGPNTGKVRTRVKDGAPQTFVLFAGRWKSFPDFPGATLLSSNTVIRPNERGEFFFPVPVDKDGTTSVEIKLIDGLGKMSTQRHSLKVTGIPPVGKPAEKEKKEPPPPKSAWSLSPSIGLSLLQYKETGAVSGYSSTMVTGKLGVIYTASRRINHGVSAYSNLAALSTSIPGVSAKFFGLNVRSAYQLCPDCSFQKSIALGVYYLRMNVTGNRFGFSNMIGPQIFALFRKNFLPTSNLVTYLKFAPVVGAGSSLSVSNYEAAAGISWNRKLGARWWSLGFDASMFKLKVLTVSIDANTASLSIGMLF